MTEQKHYPIEIDPAILELLGPSLYTNIYYVLAELIANSWDADASNVWIDASDKSISVEDDGKGMSYASKEINQYLAVAKGTRQSDEQAVTKTFKRPRMGRKGIGKLAALAVSNDVQVKTISNHEKSGFTLSRVIPPNKQLNPIDENNITLNHGQENGTLIEMLNPEYQLPKQTATIKRNLIKFFPQVNDKFQIHVSLNGKTETLSSFEEEVGGKLETITLFGENQNIVNFLPRDFDSELKIEESPIIQTISLKDREGKDVNIEQKIYGWIGSYASTRGQKGDKSDFPDNFIAIYSHRKLGQFNILEQAGSNRLNEVYLVGQLFIDSFEETNLPDMATSNRQGYKTDDPRYQTMIEWAESAVKKASELRDKAVTKRKKQKKIEKLNKAKENEESLKKSVDEALQTIYDATESEKFEEKKEKISEALQKVGTKALKSKENARKILISQTSKDSKINDCIYEMLIFNNFTPEEIIYTNANSARGEDRLKSKIPAGTDIWAYLREFFVTTFSDNKIYVFYIWSDNVKNSHGAVVEQGAGWVIQADHAVVKYGECKPEPPLKIGNPYFEVKDSSDLLTISQNDFDTFYEYIAKVCSMFEKTPKTLDQNRKKFEEFGNFLQY